MSEPASSKFAASRFAQSPAMDELHKFLESWGIGDFQPLVTALIEADVPPEKALPIVQAVAKIVEGRTAGASS